MPKITNERFRKTFLTKMQWQDLCAESQRQHSALVFGVVCVQSPEIYLE